MPLGKHLLQQGYSSPAQRRPCHANGPQRLGNKRAPRHENTAAQGAYH